MRCPIIPGCNDRDEHYLKIAELANTFDGITHVEIEPYHALGEGKYEALDRGVHHFEQPSDETVSAIIEKISSHTEKNVRKA